MGNILKINNLGIQFGGLKAVDAVTFSLDKKKIMGLIGPNGAGKTTVFNLLTGVYTPTYGSVELDRSCIASHKKSLEIHEIVDLGVSRTFQNIRLFKNMTVLDTIKTGFHSDTDYGLFSSIFRTKKYWDAEANFDKKARELLQIFDMEHLADRISDNLSYGEQRKLEICRALANSPKVLLLDEPAAGMNPTETIELMENIRFIRDHFEISILLIEHDMKLVMGICEEIVVLNYGKIIAQGPAEAIQNNHDVIRAYLGNEGDPTAD